MQSHSTINQIIKVNIFSALFFVHPVTVGHPRELLIKECKKKIPTHALLLTTSFGPNPKLHIKPTFTLFSAFE